MFALTAPIAVITLLAVMTLLALAGLAAGWRLVRSALDVLASVPRENNDVIFI